MSYEKDIRNKELEKLKRSPFFDDKTLKEIREDLERLNEDELKESQSIINNNTEYILTQIPLKESISYFKFAFLD